MTEKQKKYIEYLDMKCGLRGLKIRAKDDLGDDWKHFYKNFTPTFTEEVIVKLHKALGMPTKPMPKRKRK